MNSGYYTCRLSIERSDKSVVTFNSTSPVSPGVDEIDCDLKVAQVLRDPSSKNIYSLASSRGPCVYFYSGTDQHDMDAVVRLAEKQNAAAVLLFRAPVTKPLLPVFVVNPANLEPWVYSENEARIRIEQVDRNQEPQKERGLISAPSQPMEGVTTSSPTDEKDSDLSGAPSQPMEGVTTAVSTGDHPLSDGFFEGRGTESSASISFLCEITVLLPNETLSFMAASKICPGEEGEFAVHRDLRVVDEWRNQTTNEITSITLSPSSVARRVMAYNGTEASDIDAVVRIAGIQSVAALFLPSEPRITPTLPVFVVESGILKQIERQPHQGKAIIQVIDKRVEPSLPFHGSRSDDVPRKSPKQVKKNVVVDLPTEGASAACTSPAVASARMDDSVDTDDVLLDNDKKQSRSLFRKVKDLGRDAMKAITGPDGWDTVLQDSGGWKKKGDFRRYRESMERLKTATEDNNRETIDKLSKAVLAFLRKSKVFPLHIVFASEVVIQTEAPELATYILGFLLQMHKSNSRDDQQVTGLMQACGRAFWRYTDKAMKPVNIMRRFFETIFGRWWELGPFRNQDDLLICIFRFWAKCDLFSDSTQWHKVRLVVPHEFYDRNKDHLKMSLKPRAFRMLGLFLCCDMEQIRSRLVQICEETRQPSASVSEAFVLNLIAQSKVSINEFSEDMNAVRDWWDNTLAVLRLLREQKAVERVLASLVQHSSFREKKTFRFYSPLYEVLQPEQRCYRSLLDLTRRNLHEDLRSAHSLREEEFLQLLDSNVGELLSTPVGKDAVKGFAERKVRSETSFSRGLLFANSLHTVLASKKAYANGLNQLVADLVEASMESHRGGIPSIWEACIGIAVASPMLFHSSDNTLVRSVASRVFDGQSGATLLREPSLVVDLTRYDRGTVHGALYHGLQERIKTVLCQSATTIGLASKFLLQLPTDSAKSGEFGPSEQPVLTIAEHVFCEAFQKWNPRSVSDIVAQSSYVLDLLFRCFKHCPASTIEHRKKIEDLVESWSLSYHKGEISCRELNETLGFVDKPTWNMLSSFVAPDRLPNQQEVSGKVHEAEKRTEAIVECLSGPDGRSISVVLKGYNCVPADSSTLGRLLSTYGVLLEENVTGPGIAFSTDDLTLTRKENDLRIAREFCTEYGGTVLMCYYFLRNPSALFRKYMASITRSELDIRTLQVALRDTLAKIGCLFGRATTFEDVDSAVKIVTSAGSTLQKELAILSDPCVGLNLATADKDRFQAVAAMSRLADPLHDFIKFCSQFQFSVVNYPEFDKLADASDALRSGSVLAFDTEACMDFFGRLSELLCLGIVQNSSAEEVLRHMNRKLPCIELLGRLTSHSEVWTFTREMNWFGDDGLKRFYDEYNNVTNVLLGNTASYEMSVLDALGPTVRVVSIIGGLRGDSNVASLLSAMECSSDIFDYAKERASEDLGQVQRNLSQVREWFTDGVDEIASVFCAFEAASKSGTFCILPVQDGKHYLALEFRNKGKQELLWGGALSRFTQYVSLIQHEDEEVSARVNSFAEQYQMLATAAANTLKIFDLGFSADVTALSCPVGQEHIDLAKHLLRNSEAARQDQEGQLRQISEVHPASLLFYFKELQHIYEVVARNDALQSSQIELLQKLSRLLHSPSQSTALAQVISQTAFRSDEDFLGRGDGWLKRVSKYIEDLHLSIGDMALPCLRRTTEASQVVLHTINFVDGDANRAIFSLIRCIYEDRLPRDLEMLDATGGCALDDMDVFLRRAITYTDQVFVIVNVDCLNGSLADMLVSFLSRREVATSGMRLHLVQRSSSLLHSGPWVEGRNWDQESLQVEEARLGLVEASWRLLILDSLSLEAVFIVWTAQSGTGKTRYIYEELKKIEEQDATAEVAVVTIHEKSSNLTLIDDLISKFSRSTGKKAVHFSFGFMPARTMETREWLDFINRFFFSFLVFRSVFDHVTGRSFHLGEGKWTVFVEFPAGESSCLEQLQLNIPVLASCGTWCCPSNDFIIDIETRRVCTYLRALENGTINRKFEGSRGRRMVFVLDWSGSMKGQPLNTATDNALTLFDTHVNVGDKFGVTMFDNRTTVQIPLREIVSESHKSQLRNQLDHVRYGGGGGTAMYGALLRTFLSLESQEAKEEAWIVCLTDGISADSPHLIRDHLLQSSENVHIVVVGINLSERLEGSMRDLCGKFRQCPNGIFVPASASVAGLNAAFARVARCIPVSQTFELYEGVASDDECRDLLHKFGKDLIERDDQRLRKFWVRFLFRRVSVFDMNTDFNENVKHERLGSTLMETMLDEVKRLLNENQRHDWTGENHAQLVYDFEDPQDPKFRLVCTSPNDLPEDLRRRYECLDLPGFKIPTQDELSERETLHGLLSQAIGVPLNTNADGDKLLKCIDENGFILTLDFTMKLLNIHERVACRLPCLVEGETGVSKTALTKMYAILRNSALKSEADVFTANAITDIEDRLNEQKQQGKDFSSGSGETSLLRLQDALNQASNSSIGDETELAGMIHKLLLDKLHSRSCLFRPIPSKFDTACISCTSTVQEFLVWFSEAHLEQTFFDINVDASLSEKDVIAEFSEIRKVAQKILEPGALVVVFLDEINTTSVMGLFKEIVMDHCLKGEHLEDNIVVVAACNPCRQEATTSGCSTREKDLGKEWASGHYQVVELPEALEQVKWAFGSLSHDQEKDFIFRRMEKLGGSSLSPSLQRGMTEVVAASHEAMRRFAEQHILLGLKRANVPGETLVSEAAQRAKSVVSLRDIQRVFGLYEFIVADLRLPEIASQRDAMMLAVAIVYYLRLDGKSRSEFKEILARLPTERGSNGLQMVLDTAMDALAAMTDIPDGIALTRGLKENIFMTVVCLLSRTPLLIVGPPGSSKTLAVNLTSDNANGVDSPGMFYRKHPRLSLYHYQCSKESTSKEIAAVFEKALQRQSKSDAKKDLSFVFMDEAGLPPDRQEMRNRNMKSKEKEMESMKVLHYLLEGHMSAKPEVGFVAISNHILDAAKSNRCAMLLRQEPDTDEMMSITSGVLFETGGTAAVEEVDLDGELLSVQEFTSRLRSCYSEMTKHFSWFEAFFGLRDFIYFLKALRASSTFEMLKVSISPQSIIHAVERNFNGLGPARLRQMALCVLQMVTCRAHVPLMQGLVKSFRDPLEVIRQALSPANPDLAFSSRPRYKLIIDETEDDSIMRLLGSMGAVDLSKDCLLKLSQLPEDGCVERMRLVSRVKYAAMQGKLVVLSQTEPINEAMYDLFNQRFSSVGERLYANIAIEGISRRCLVRPSFECVVHIRASQLHQIPAPFLNRFEKYSLGTAEVLAAGWARLGKVAATIFSSARDRALKLVGALGKEKGFFGWVDGQTIDSVFIDLLPCRTFASQEPSSTWVGPSEPNCFSGCLVEFLGTISSLRLKQDDVTPEIDLARLHLPEELLRILEHMTSDHAVDIALVRESMFSTLRANRVERGQLEELCIILAQMVVTRTAVSRLLQIATPEAIHLNSPGLPKDLLSEYFSQEHFSLRRMLDNATETHHHLQKMIVYTRSDAFVHSLPTYPTTDCSEVKGRVAKIKELVYGNIEELVVEHLSTLRSEVKLRTSIEAWVKSKQRRVYVLIIDMSLPDAVEHANFCRTVAEQRLHKESSKAFVMLMHFSPSVANRFTCYPALFLQGWKHIFLDGIGDSGHAFQVDACMKWACMASFDSDQRKSSGGTMTNLGEYLQTLLPQVTSRLATFTIISPKQLEEASLFARGDVAFSARHHVLLSYLTKRIEGEGETILSAICSKFSSLWLERSLAKTMRRASENLLNGRTQLSLSMSLKSNLHSTFYAYALSMVNEMNKGQNLDVLSSDSSNCNVEKLFGLILRGLPVAPFEELLLHQVPLGARENPSRAYRFPFFLFVSACLEDFLELALKESLAAIHESGATNLVDIVSILRSRFADQLDEGLDSGEVVTEQRQTVVRDVMNFVRDESPCDCSLFELYLEDFASWKAECPRTRLLVNWVRRKATSVGFGRDLFVVHVLAKLEEREFMSVASWATSPTTVASLQSETAPGDGCKLFLSILSDFEAALGDNGTKQTEWTAMFGRFLRQTRPLIGNWNAVHDSQACRLRVLSFFYVLLCCNVPRCVESMALQLWYDQQSRKLKDDIALGSLCTMSNFMGILREAGAWKKRTIEMAFRHFFSESWICITTLFQTEDFSALLDYLSDEDIPGVRQASLLRGACLSFKRSSEEHQLTAVCIAAAPLQMLCSRLETNGAPLASSTDRRRTSLPHFIPGWLRTEHSRIRGTTGRRRQESNESPEELFFANYSHSFVGHLSEVVFLFFLQLIGEHYKDSSSDVVLLSLLDDIDRETNIRQGTNTVHDGSSTLSGSLVSTLSLDARLTFLVGLVAFELATTKWANAFSGTYGSTGRAFFELAMSQTGFAWQGFFFGTIIRVRGEGIASSLLAPGGALHDFTWVKAWISSSPKVEQQAREALEQAEKALADTTQEETRKETSVRLCPHCGNQFMVDARNCGTFYCGRDAHGTMNGGHGCGKQFGIDYAGHYVSDSAVLDPLRRKVQEVSAALTKCKNDSIIWEEARKMRVPVLGLKFDRGPREQAIFPSVSLSCQSHRDKAGASTSSLLRRLREGSHFVLQQQLLPDLIELYMWLHSTFQFLVSKNDAITLTMKDIMKEEKLRTRFGISSASRIAGLWARTVEGWKRYLEFVEGKVFWECQEIAMPCMDIENAPLITLLSEGSHPTDGNDFLFLVINAIIDRYNAFVRWLGDFEVEEEGCDISSDGPTQIHPKFVTRGSYGAVAISTVVVLSEQELDLLIAGAWNPESHSFDTTWLDEALKRELTLHLRRPMLLNPLKYLRERFVFRDDTGTLPTAGSLHDSISQGGDGNYYANAQDCQLYNNVSSLLERFPLEGSESIRRVLADAFHNFDYQELQSILEGVRNMVQLVQTERMDEIDDVGQIVSSVFHVSLEDLQSEGMLLLGELGFKGISKSQADLLISLKSDEIVELVRFAGSQLSSEAYLFSALPLSLKEPLREQQTSSLDSSFDRLKSQESTKHICRCLDEFVRDVLSFYEVQILREDSPTQTLQAFLLKNNCCETSDPIFTLIPCDVKLSNYVSLRRHFHQMKLASLFHEETVETEDRFDLPPGAESGLGKCWLWDGENSEKPSDAAPEVGSEYQSLEKSPDLLWFARDMCYPSSDDMELDTPEGGKNTSISHESDPGEETLAPLSRDEDAAARKIQLWWRECAEGGEVESIDDEILERGEVEYMDDETLEAFVFDEIVETNCEKKEEQRAPKRIRLSDPADDGSYSESGVEFLLDSLDEEHHVPSIAEKTYQEIPTEARDSRRNSHDDPSSDASGHSQTRYDEERAEEMRLREWLYQNMLPPSVADFLIDFGARNISDIALIFEECEEDLLALKKLDRIKLKKAVQRLEDED